MDLNYRPGILALSQAGARVARRKISPAAPLASLAERRKVWHCRKLYLQAGASSAWGWLPRNTAARARASMEQAIVAGEMARSGR